MCHRHWCTAVAAALLLAGVARADNNEWAQLGGELMAAGQYAAALKAYEKITETYEHIIVVNFDKAWCYYLTGAYAKAIPLFERLSGVRAPSEDVRQQSFYLLAESKARLGEQLDEKDAERRKNIRQAIDLQTQFQSRYPKSGFIPNSFYGRGFAYFLDGQFEKAEADLAALIRTWPQNSIARDAQYLLAHVYSRQALKLIQAGKAADAQPLMDKARLIFGQLAKIEGNLAMANDSAFALAETWFNAGYYPDAIRYFREVRSKEDVLQDLKARLATLERQRAAAIGRKEEAAPLKAEMDRLRAQYSAINDNPDLMVSAYLRMVLCFFHQKQFGETRQIARHLLNFIQGADRKQIAFLAVSACLEDKEVDGAAAALADFRREFGPSDPLAEVAGLAVGQLLIQFGRAAEALPWFAQNAADYPEGKAIEDAVFMQFSAEFVLERFSNVVATAATYLEKFPKGKYVPNALYLRAMSQASLQQWEAALGNLDDLVRRFPKNTEHFKAADEAAYQRGWILYQKALTIKPESAAGDERAALEKTKKAALTDAIKQFERFLVDNKESPLRPVAMYQFSIVLNAAGQLENAKAVLQALARQFPQHEIAPTALYQVAVMYFEKEDFANMGPAMQELVKAFPNAPIAPEAYYWIGFIARKDQRLDDAIAACQQSVKLAPQGKLAPDCLLIVAQVQREKAEAMGSPMMMSEERKGQYRDGFLQACRVYEDLMIKHPDSVQGQEAVAAIAQNIYDLTRARLLPDDEAAAWLRAAAARHNTAPEIKARLILSLASYYLKTRQQDQALAAFKEAFSIRPDIRMSAMLFSDYAEALKGANQLADAEKIYNRIINDFADDERALAPAWFGIADIKFRQNDFEAAKTAFENVVQRFPWYEPGKQGRVKLAMILEQQARTTAGSQSKQSLYEQAEKMHFEVWKQERGEPRIAALVGVARCQLERAQLLRQAGQINDMKVMIKAANESATRVIVMFEAFPDYVAEALWINGQLYELAGQQLLARQVYDRLVREYKNHSWAKPAAERLQKLGGPPPPTAAAAAAP